MDADRKKKLEQVLAAGVFSDRFRIYTALVALPTFAAGAAGAAGGCAGWRTSEMACDPAKHHRHQEHIELSTSTAVASFSVSGLGTYTLKR